MGLWLGEEKVLLLMENFWKETFFSDIFKITIGKNYNEFDEEWLYALKKQYYPLLADHDLPSSVTRKSVGADDVCARSRPGKHTARTMRYKNLHSDCFIALPFRLTYEG